MWSCCSLGYPWIPEFDMVKRFRTWFEPSGPRPQKRVACICWTRRLELCGYEDEDANLYSDIGYTVRSFHPFRVGEGFPRIVSGDLQVGIGGVHYSVSLASCAPFRVKERQPDDLLVGMV